MRKQYRLTLDSVEKRYLAKLKGNRTEYRDLELADIAHLELKDYLRQKFHTSGKYAETGLLAPNLEPTYRFYSLTSCFYAI